MKITITSEVSGTEIVSNIIANLAASTYKIEAKDEDIKTQVQNKNGQWVDFEPSKIRFYYQKSNA